MLAADLCNDWHLLHSPADTQHPNEITHDIYLSFTVLIMIFPPHEISKVKFIITIQTQTFTHSLGQKVQFLTKTKVFRISQHQKHYNYWISQIFQDKFQSIHLATVIWLMATLLFSKTLGLPLTQNCILFKLRTVSFLICDTSPNSFIQCNCKKRIIDSSLIQNQ